MDNELNKKLAEWAGFNLIDTQFYEHSFGNSEVELWLEPSGLTAQGGVPNFTQSLDACFKWLVPKVLEEHTIIESYSFKQESGLYYSETCVWNRDERQLKGKLVGKAFIQDFDLERANALAPCLAIEKLIDGGK